MSSGIKRCAPGRQCVIAELYVGDRSRDDWTEIQEFDCRGKCLIMQCGETTCCQRRSGRVNDEGNDLLLNSDRGVEGVVVSKEEVVPGRKGSGGAWGSTSRNAGLAGPAPQNGRIRTLAEKKSHTFDRRAVGCNSVVLKMACSQSHCKVQAPFSATPCEQFKVLRGAWCLSPKMRCVSFFILN
jgi:hypothetical protein